MAGWSLRRAWAKVRAATRALGDLGPRTSALVVVGTLRTELAVRRRAAGGAAAAVEPGSLRTVEDIPHGARVVFDRASVEVELLAADLVRLAWGPGVAAGSYAVVDPLPWPAPPAAVTRIGGPSGGVRVASAGVEVEVDGRGAVSVRRPGGPVLLAQHPPRRRGGSWSLRRRLRAGEHLAGLGEQAAPLDLRRGHPVHRLWNRDPGGAWGPGTDPLYMPLPVLVGAHPDGDVLTFDDNPSEGTVTVGDDEVEVRFAAGGLRRYVVVGSLPDLVRCLAEFTGRPPLPPRWALGYHQSRWGYRTEADVRAVAEGFASRRIPLSAVHLDIDHMDGYRVFTVDRRRFPDLAKLAGDLRRRGVRLVSIVDPGLKVDRAWPLYRQAVAAGVLCRTAQGRLAQGVVWPGRCAFPDFTDPDCRDWWAQHYQTLLHGGVAGVWHDMNEPTSIALWGDRTLDRAVRHRLDGRGGTHAEAHNVYGMLMNRSGFQGLQAAAPRHRPFIVSRSGWVGTQRAAWNWTGDSETSWASLRQQIATLVHLGLSGVAFSGSDIGGFSGVPDDELYLRWLQMSVFVPFCRTHSVVGVPAREPWRFTAETAALVASWIRFRYRLLPYLYTLAHEAATSGLPPVRPSAWPLSDADPDPSLWEVDDQFLLGESLLVAPVAEPAVVSRLVRLPPGGWSSMWAALPPPVAAAAAGPLSARGGRRMVAVAAPLARLPLLVRAGSIVPLDDDWVDGGPCTLGGDAGSAAGVPPAELDPGHRPRRLAFHCWPDAAGVATGHCVDDEGDGYGERRRDDLELQLPGPDGGAPGLLTWSRRGRYRAPSSIRLVLHGVALAGASADGRPVAVRAGAEASVLDTAPFDRLELHLQRPAVPTPGG